METVDEYRSLVTADDLVFTRVRIGESDLMIRADREPGRPAREALVRYRREIERYLSEHPGFRESLVPVRAAPDAPDIIRSMARSGFLCGVGPMAAVAGALAFFVGRDLSLLSPEVIVENGGDIYLACRRERNILVYPGEGHPVSRNLGIRIVPGDMPAGVAASSGTRGRSLSWGRAAVAVVVADDPVLADAAATALGNRIYREERSVLAAAGEAIGSIPGVRGSLVVCGGLIAVRGRIELVGL
ncbi:MAG: UPF0280 family protein [PVC group bacterium]